MWSPAGSAPSGPWSRPRADRRVRGARRRVRRDRRHRRFRAGWGLGNALFIATALAVIVGSAIGGFAGAIILYETALGLGIACGPLLGGALGNISWRGPFFGVSVLMAIALVATVVLVPRRPSPRTGPAARRRSGRCATAACSPWASPRCSTTGASSRCSATCRSRWACRSTGWAAVFFGWGVLVAVFSVFVAPRLQAPLRHRPGAVRQPRAVRRACSRVIAAVHRLPGRAGRRASSSRARSSASTTR